MHETNRLRILLTEGFRALDVAVALPSFDSERPAVEVRRVMEALGATVAGLRISGHVRGWVAPGELTGELACEHLRPFNKGQVLPDDAALHEAIEVLDRDDYCFLATLGTVDAVVSRADLDKPSARMWLFGNITIIETLMSWTIEQRYPACEWHSSISAARLKKAEYLLGERRRRGQDVSLIDCLQLADKMDILIRDPEVLADAGFPSRRSAKDFMRRLQSLRNSLAHSQELQSGDWPAIARLAARLHTLMGRLVSSAEKIDNARQFAMDAHDRIGQRRKYTREPYWVHLEAVTRMVGNVTRDTEVLAASWLHDTVEDTPVTLEEIKERFGERVAGLVGELTNPSRSSDGNRALRSKIDHQHAAGASPESQTIRLADIIDNVRSISEQDPRFGRVYVAEKETLLDVLQQGDASLLARAREALRVARDLVGEG